MWKCSPKNQLRVLVFLGFIWVKKTTSQDGIFSIIVHFLEKWNWIVPIKPDSAFLVLTIADIEPIFSG
ncbi:hypothetical protein BGS_0479 [Beggiatoa sp. SS]|nr:hypothetical protein BGS_0479 [Beggiatoa sp. SS]